MVLLLYYLVILVIMRYLVAFVAESTERFGPPSQINDGTRIPAVLVQPLRTCIEDDYCTTTVGTTATGASAFFKVVKKWLRLHQRVLECRRRNK
jgi:hypothetical protein